ncbi:zf-DNL-domain-containing protein [Delitschia confertaspora ATCC 74209]|uniref:Zf-DNL-domain-containing protein n=1 Tax=Delitschia confertaspora ATCC 74209 TaxID=1513339 RepID=A0A9P4JTU9_9PLEO|nr:zf-DNL-domain-containing protein [Delitschia confertaspora ATCC 74209]
MRSAAPCLRSLARAATSQAPRALPSGSIPASQRLYHTPRASTPLRPQLLLRRRCPISSIIRYESNSSTSSPQTPPPRTEPLPSRLDRDQVPQYEMTFTCKKCTTRSSHRISKQGYHHGTVLITCPGCKNRHLISDHLKIFSDKPVTIEDLMREKGQLVKRGSLSTEGDVEFWDDGTTTARSANFIPHTPDADSGKDRFREQPSSQDAPADTADSPTRKP